MRDIEIMLPRRRVGLAGEYLLQTGKNMGYIDAASGLWIPGRDQITGEVGPFSNIITNLGLDHIGNLEGYGDYCQVGEGNAAESVADTTLDAYTASQAVSIIGTGAAQGTPPYYGSCQRKYRFPANFAGGAVNIPEVGCSTQAATGDLFNRALIKDGGGTPTTIAVSSTEYLDVYYTLRNYPDHVNYTSGATDDGTGSVTIEGVSYNYTIRCADITNYRWWGRNLFTGFNLADFPSIGWRTAVWGSDAALGAVTGSMSGTSTVQLSAGSGNETLGTYSNSTYTNTITFHWDFGEGNVTGGIAGMLVTSAFGAYQILFATPIPKTSGEQLNYTQRTTWTRKAL